MAEQGTEWMSPTLKADYEAMLVASPALAAFILETGLPSSVGGLILPGEAQMREPGPVDANNMMVTY
jgi:hypothetical protein